jgi:hypothetical protein
MSRARRTVWTVISEATCQPTIMHLLASTNTDVGHPFGGADVGEVRDPEGVRTFRVKDPVNEVRGDVGATASLRRRHSSATLVTPHIPDIAMSRATWSRPTSERLAVRR